MGKPPATVPEPGASNGNALDHYNTAIRAMSFTSAPVPVPPGPSAQGIHWQRYFAAVARYKWMILAVTLVGTGAGWIGTRFVPLTFVAQATLWIEGGSRALEGPIRTPELLQPEAWIDLLKSYVVLDSVVLARRLYIRYEPADRALFTSFDVREGFRAGDYVLTVDDAGASFQLATRGGEVLATGRPGDPVAPELGFVWTPPASELRPGRRVAFGVDHPRDAARRLGNDLRASIDRGGTFLRIELAGTDPERVAATVNALADRHVEVAAALKREKLDQRAAIIQTQLLDAERSMTEAEIALEEFRVQTITLPDDEPIPIAAGIDATRAPVLSEFFARRMDREQVQRDRRAIQRALEAYEQGEPIPIEALEVVESVQNSSELREALNALAQRRAQLRDLRLQYTDEHPAVQSLVGAIDELENQHIPALAFRLVAELTHRERELDGIIATTSAELEQIPTRSSQEARLERRVAIDEALYTSLRHSYEQARLASLTTVPDVRVLDRAAVPRWPVNDQRLRLLLVAVAGSLCLGLFGALVLDRIDTRMRYPEQVTRELGLPVLGGVPRVDPHNRRQRSMAAVEAFRAIRVNLTHCFAPGENIVVTVSSAMSGDGKSFVSGNLAMAFAGEGRTTLLVDGDVRRGDVHRLIGARRKPGLIDYLAGTHGLDEIVQATSNRNLYFVGGGSRRQNGPELLGNPRLASLLAEMRKRFQVIIVDSPPMGGAADAFLLAALTGNLVFVVRTGVTDRALAAAKLDLVDRLPIRLIGAVLNAVPPSTAYGYYYSYHIPGYEVEEEAATKEIPAAATSRA